MGVPSIVMQSIGSVMTFGMNKILFVFTPTATAVFGAYFKIQSFIFMPVFGLNNGLVPIVSYNYGARKKQRLMEAIRFGSALAVGIMLVGLVVIQLFPAPILSLYEASADMLRLGVGRLPVVTQQEAADIIDKIILKGVREKYPMAQVNTKLMLCDVELEDITRELSNYVKETFVIYIKPRIDDIDAILKNGKTEWRVFEKELPLYVTNTQDTELFKNASSFLYYSIDAENDLIDMESELLNEVTTF